MAKTVQVFILILVLHVLESALANKLSSLSLADECSLLFQFKQNMTIKKPASGDPRAYPKVASWNLNGSDGAGNCCLWDGVECRFGHVIGLDLSSSFLYGTISSNNSLFDLIHLRTLNLADNSFCSSQIPLRIGRLLQLETLNLSYSVFSGEIPKQFSQLRNLVSLDLSRNGLKMQSSDFQNLVQNSSETLRELFLSEVNIDSELPASIGNLTHLNILALRECAFTGALPASIGDFYLFLSLQKLKHLDLSGNNISLSVIDSHKNESQPKFIGLRMASCNLKAFPEFLQFQHQLESLNLDDNNIEGLIPGWIFNISKETLRKLSLAHNMLTGEIPPSICDLLSLQLLHLSFNNITGSIPPCLEKLSNSLVLLSLRRNSLQGTIPNIFTSGSSLQMIDLSENNLEGQVPRSLENCKSLLFLDLGHNLIEDRFPVWLGALPELQVLILRFNNFHGNIRRPSSGKVSFPKLRIIDLSYNSFSGDLPPQYFQEWSAMKESEPSVEYMLAFMEYDHTMVGYWLSIQITNKGVKTDYVKISEAFFAVDLSGNMFRGNIPESITTLSGLQLLNLSNNELSGVIPPSMGDLTRLEALDISGNKLSGMIPQDLVQLNFLAFLNVSNNNLTGPIPQGKQFNTFSNDSYMGNALCGFPLSMKCGDSEASKPPNISSEEDTESDFPNGIDGVVILIGVVSGLVIGLVCGDYLSTKYYWWFSQRSRR
ncbi:putative leucine-rich repeat-containing, plant-type, leucine-rich repeat domain superfamily [Helianthus annuus]|nr:putative leucine-rich repeat-containing, plant-type, leucine-rich repeat domain superfamily [Helianthus annuus]